MAKTENAHPSEHALAKRPAYVQKIGMIVLETVDLEVRLARMFRYIIDVPTRTAQAIYFSPKAEQARMDILRNSALAAFHVKPSATGTLARQKRKALEKVERLLARSEKLIRKRHRIVHDEWNVSEADKTVTRRLIGGELNRKRDPVQEEELDNLLKSLRELIDDVYDLSEEFRQRPPSMVSMAKDAPIPRPQ